MKILVVADTHGELQPHQLPQETLFIKPDGIFLLGDVFINDIELLKQFYPTVSILGVGGNHDKWDLLSEKDSLADAPKKIFNFLFKHRVKYDEAEHNKYQASLKKK